MAQAQELSVDSIIQGLTTPDKQMQKLIRKAATLKSENPTLWGRIAAAVFGLSTKKGADLLMPHAVAIQARHLNYEEKGRYALNAEHTFWL